jgi:hypothetical protein
LPLEPSQDAAQVGNINLQLFGDSGSGQVLLAGDFIQDTHLGQGLVRTQVPLVKQTKLPGIEAIKAPHGINLPAVDDPTPRSALALSRGFHERHRGVNT